MTGCKCIAILLAMFILSTCLTEVKADSNERLRYKVGEVGFRIGGGTSEIADEEGLFHLWGYYRFSLDNVLRGLSGEVSLGGWGGDIETRTAYSQTEYFWGSEGIYEKEHSYENKVSVMVVGFQSCAIYTFFSKSALAPYVGVGIGFYSQNMDYETEEKYWDTESLSYVTSPGESQEALSSGAAGLILRLGVNYHFKELLIAAEYFAFKVSEPEEWKDMTAAIKYEGKSWANSGITVGVGYYF